MDLLVWCGIETSFFAIQTLSASPAHLIFSSGFEEGDALTIETSWRHWMDDAESLLWIESAVRSVRNVIRVSFVHKVYIMLDISIAL